MAGCRRTAPPFAGSDGGSFQSAVRQVRPLLRRSHEHCESLLCGFQLMSLFVLMLVVSFFFFFMGHAAV